MFKSKINLLTHQLNIAIRNSYADNIEKCRSDQVKLLSLVNSVSNPKLEVEHPTTTSLTKLANEVRKLFVTKIELIREKLDDIETDAWTSDY